MMYHGNSVEGNGRLLNVSEQSVHNLKIRTEKKSEQWHYYISSRNLSAKELLHHARQEWSVETMHWLLDVLFGEDGCRIQTKTAQQNLNMVRKLGS